MVYACLPNKNTETYVRLFAMLREKIVELDIASLEYEGPTVILVYFETAAINALKQVFSSARIKGNAKQL